MIPKGGIGLGILDKEKNWVDKSELLAVGENGKPASLVPSSFSQPINLEKTVTYEEFLDHYITYVYILEKTENSSALTEAVRNGPIYKL